MAKWQFDRRFIRSVRVLMIFIGILGLVYSLPALLLRIPSIQRWAGEQASSAVSQLLDTPVSIERVSMDGWQSVELQRVSILDDRQRPALEVRRLLAGVDLWKLLGSDVVTINSIRGFDLRLRLRQNTKTSRLNIQHIIDALSSSDAPPSLTLAIHTILLRNANVSYSVDDTELIHAEHLGLQINRILSNDEGISGVIDELRFRSPQGFELERMQTAVTLRSGHLGLTDFICELPDSHISIPRLEWDLGASVYSALRALEIERVSLAISDLAPLYAPLESLSGEYLTLSGQFLPQRDRLDISDLSLHLGDYLGIDAQMSLRTKADGAMDALEIQARRIGVSTELVRPLRAILPTLDSLEILDQLAPLGQMVYNGELSWHPDDNLRTRGTLTTALGRWSTDTKAYLQAGSLSQIDARLSTQDFDLAPLTDGALGLGHLAGELEAVIEFAGAEHLPIGKGRIALRDVDLMGHRYRSITADITGDARGQYTAHLMSDDPMANLEAGLGFALRQGEMRDMHLELATADVFVGKLLAGALAPLDRVRVEGAISLSSLDLHEAEGRLHIPSITLSSTSGEILELSDVEATLEREAEISQLHLSTPWLRANLRTSEAPDRLPALVLHALYQQMPVLRSLAPPAPRQARPDSFAEATVELDSIPQALRRVLPLPFEGLGRTRLSARYAEPGHSLETTITTDSVTLGGYRLQGTHARLSEQTLTLMSDIRTSGGGRLDGAGLIASLRGDSIHLLLDLGRDSAEIDNGHLELRTILTALPLPPAKPRRLSDLGALIEIYPSRLRVHTTDWDIAPAQVALTSSSVDVRGLEITTPGRSIRVSGGLGSIGTSSLRADVERINLKYILEAIGVDLDLLDTDLTGAVEARIDSEGIIRAGGRVTSPGFYVLGHNAGAIDIDLGWNSDDLLILLNGNVSQPHGGRSKVNGFIKPANGAGIDLAFDATDLDVTFVGRFLSDIFDRVGGFGTGSVRLHGLFEDGVTVSGEADIRDGSLGIKVLGTQYFFDHRLRLEDDRIDIRDLRVRDDEGHTASVNGVITHRYFGDFSLNLRADDMRQLKVLQTTSPKDMPVYGTAYGSGYATMTGNGDLMKIGVNLRSERGTDVTLDFNPVTAGRDQQLVRFTRLRPDSLNTPDSSLLTLAPELETASFIDLDLSLAVTPDARLGMRLTTDTSSEIRGRGEGTLRIQAPSLGDAQVYGSLNVLDGVYTFNLEQFAHKRFTIREGGQIAFRGNPMIAHIDLDAVYTLMANISDLDESLSAMAGRTNIPVNCILSLGGNVSRPDIRFNLELPGVDSDIERRVRSLINTEDAMLRQMLYLIALGKFYSEESASRSSEATDNWTAVANSALSEQLSSLLGNLSNSINLGTSIRTRNTAFEDTDIELLFSGNFFGDRLLVNGNVGYHDNPYLSNTYLGEFELEYKLTRQGSLRLKGYNRYNSLYQYLRQSLMTQGLGFIFRQRFDRLPDLWRRNQPIGPAPTPDTTRHVSPDSTALISPLPDEQ